MVNEVMDPQVAHFPAISLNRCNLYLYFEYLTLYLHIGTAHIKKSFFLEQKKIIT